MQEDSVKYKKYFYALRPLFAGRYVQEFELPPPVLFDNLMKMDMPPTLFDGIMELLEIKKNSDEKDVGIQFPIINDFIATEIVQQKKFVENMKDDRKREWNHLNELFLNVLG